eukprot:TRINITY_DN3264_c0_g1_i1.p1 TRINITY_DN3264_c0_g1~~TRINITY_DN3264_c0_g1_i1.p1  ORF type:complete len:242 (+),score=72.44 TRINITY_DN3264_c0_g1_i1:92-817(+)
MKSSNSTVFEIIAEGSTEEVKRALAGGANVNDADESGLTPLHVAVTWNRVPTIELLLKEGADVNAKSAAGDTPLTLAQSSELWDVVELLLRSGATPPEDVISREEVARVVEEQNELEKLAPGRSLRGAVAEGTADEVRALLDGGADVNAAEPGPEEEGLAPIHVAVMWNRLDLVDLLVSRGADMERPTDMGDTPLAMAANGGQWEMAQRLIALGAQVTPEVEALVRQADEEGAATESKKDL